LARIEEWTPREIAESCSFTSLTNRLYTHFLTEENGGEYSFNSCVTKVEDFKRWQNQFRERLFDILKIADLMKDRKSVEIVRCSELDAPFIHSSEQNKFTIEHFYIKSWAGSLIPVLLFKPKTNVTSAKTKHPAFVCTHGHTMYKSNLVGMRKNFIYPGTWAKDFTEMGCITISFDQWGWGERGFPEWKIIFKPLMHKIWENQYAFKMLQLGRTMNGLRYFDAIRCIDYLASRGDVDTSRIGIAGLSLGGSSAAWVSALDDRISLAIIAGYLNTFKASLLDIKHCSCMYTPGTLQSGEMSDIISLIAPRAVCFITGKKDTIFPITAAQDAFEKVKQAYSLFGASDECVLDITPKGHGWRGDVAYPFVKNHWFTDKKN